MTFGTPSVYTAELAEEICARLAAGESLKAICRDPDMPPFSTVQGWARDNHHGFAAMYDRARELLHALIERAFALIDDTDALAALPG